MAKVMDPLRSSEARGKVGGLIYNTARSVKYVKTFTSPTQPRTKVQLSIRACMQLATRTWATLDQATRDLWIAYAAGHPEIDWTGTSIAKSGFNWYCRLYSRKNYFFETSISNPPGVSAPNAPTSFNAGEVAGGLHTTWVNPGQAGTYVQLFLVGPHSSGVQAKVEKASFNCQEVAASAGKNIDTLSPGQYTLFARIISSATGLTSVWVSDTGLVT